VPPGCGDGVITEDEACDDGSANSDTEADACRTDCREARCGDATVDTEESCDDGARLGGDGCSSRCATEQGPAEEEPNDSVEAAVSFTDAVDGALPTDDVDCFVVNVAPCDALSARITDGAGGCPAPMKASLYEPSGALWAVGTADNDGCPVLSPQEEPGAAWMGGGAWVVCVEGLFGEVVSDYRLEVGLVSSESLKLTPPDDLDGDGVPSRCDADDDGDGVDDLEDNCPEVANGPGAIERYPNEEGFIQDWLVVGPLVGQTSEDGCLPTPDRLGVDAEARPALGDTAEGASWLVRSLRNNRYDLLRDYGEVDPPREVYAATYVYSETERELTFAAGFDDGARVWVEDAVVQEVTSCQGVNRDQFVVDVTLPAGWSRLMLKVYDQGGGWGYMARFLDGEEPVTDLKVGLSPDGDWVSNQTDADGDGLGDVCDPSPFGD
jgi:cysteine-rich repeat protein